MSDDQLLFLFVSLILGAIVAAANFADRDRNPVLQRALKVLMLLVNVAILFLYGIWQVVLAYGVEAGEDFTPPTKTAAYIALVEAVLAASLASAVLSRHFRERLTVIFPHWRGKSKRQDVAFVEPDLVEASSPRTPLFPQMLNYYTTDSIMVPRPSAAGAEMQEKRGDFSPEDRVRGFDPASYVHLVALLAVIYLLGTTFINVALGGLEGLAESYEETGLSTLDLLINAFSLLLVSVLGVGLGIRRNLPQTLERLGLHRPTLEGVGVSIALTVALFVFVASVSALWMALVSEETYKEQTQASDALTESITSVWLAFVLAATAAIGEEIAFRGALQPVFGFWPTAVIFALTHAQYALTPAWLIIFGVAIGFGWIRQRYSTSVAILTHFMYNFIPLAITVAAPQETTAWLMRLLT